MPTERGADYSIRLMLLGNGTRNGRRDSFEPQERFCLHYFPLLDPSLDWFSFYLHTVPHLHMSTHKAGASKLAAVA